MEADLISPQVVRAVTKVVTLLVRISLLKV